MEGSKMEFLKSLWRQANKEPLALLAVALAVLGFLYEREFFQRWLRVEPIVTAFHLRQSDGTCPMVAFEVMNNGTSVASEIRISILEDWITARGDEELLILTFEEALIGPNEKTVIERRDPLDVPTTLMGNTFVIPDLQPGEYVQRLLSITVDPKMAEARRGLVDDPRHRNRPRIGQATYEGGPLYVERNGSCLEG